MKAPAPPLAHRVLADMTLPGDAGIVMTTGRVQHDLRAQLVAVRALVPPGDLLQPVPLSGGQPDRAGEQSGHEGDQSMTDNRRLPIMTDPTILCMRTH